MDGKQKLGKKNLQYSPEQIASHAASPPPHRRVGRLTAASHAGPDRRQPPPVYHVTCARCERGGEITQLGTKWGGLLGWEIIWIILTGCDRSVTIRFREF